MSEATGRRVFRLRLRVALLVGGLAGAVAGPAFELLIAGWAGGGLLAIAVLLGGLIGAAAGLAATGLLNLALSRVEDGLAPSAAALVLLVFALLIMIAAYIAFGASPTGRIGFPLTVITALVGIPAAVVTAHHSSETAG